MPGANDGASGSGLLLELANQLRGKREGPSVWLVWLDGEEAFQKWTATDSVYGSRHLAEKWQKDGTAKKLTANEDVQEFYLGVSSSGRKSLRDVKHYKRRKRWLS